MVDHIRRGGSLGLSTRRAPSAPADRQPGGIEQPDLYQHAGLIPVDVLVRNLPILEADDDRDRHFHALARRGHAGQQPVDRRRVGEADNDFVHDLIGAHGARHIRHRHVRRKELADKMVAVERPHTVAADAADHGRYVVQMRIVGHRRHRGIEIAGEFGVHMALEQIDHRLLFS